MTGSLIGSGNFKRDKGTVTERDWSGVNLQWMAGDPS
jgi:hypothetical protein